MSLHSPLPLFVLQPSLRKYLFLWSDRLDQKSVFLSPFLSFFFGFPAYVLLPLFPRIIYPRQIDPTFVKTPRTNSSLQSVLWSGCWVIDWYQIVKKIVYYSMYFKIQLKGHVHYTLPFLHSCSWPKCACFHEGQTYLVFRLAGKKFGHPARMKNINLNWSMQRQTFALGVPC